MAGKWRRDTSSVTATPSTVTSSSAPFGRWAFGIGQPPRDRRGRTDIAKGRSVRSGGSVLTTLSCSASGIFAICCDLTRPIITRLARTFQSTRTRRCREQYMPLVALFQRHFLADSIIYMCVFDFRQAHRRRIQQPRHLLRAEHDRQFAGLVDGRRVLDDVGAPERDPKEEPQRGHGVIENRNMRAVRRQMQLKASDVLEARRIRRSAEECSKVPDGADVALLGLWR